MEGKGTIRIKRKNQFVGTLNSFKVYIDGCEVGKIRDSETAQYIADAGEHTIFVKPRWDWNKSRKILLDIKPGQVVDLDCGNKNGFFSLMVPFIVLAKTWFFPGKDGAIFVYCFLGVALVLYTAASFMPSFFVYLKVSKDSQESGVI